MKLEEINKETISANWNNSKWWEQVSKTPILNEEFIDRYESKLNWIFLGRFQKLTEKQIESHSNCISWDDVSFYQTLSENFIEKHKDKLNWSWISSEQKLSVDFIDKFSERLDWTFIVQNQILTSELVSKYKNKLEWRALSGFYIFSEEELIIYKDIIYWSDIFYRHPFISDYSNNKQIWKNYRRKEYERNIISRLYQQTKDRGWFVGYIYKNKRFNNVLYFQSDPYIYNDSEILITKSKIYWKDLVMVDKTSKYEPIRLVKSIKTTIK